MGEIIIGFFVGGLGFFVAAWLLARSGKFEDKYEWLGWTLATVFGVVCAIMMFFCATGLKNIDNQKFYASFQAKKQTYESSVSDERLTALERLQITEDIMKINSNLAEKQVDIVQWYNFNVDQVNKDNILELTMIN
jgi:hypothetical protein